MTSTCSCAPVGVVTVKVTASVVVSSSFMLLSSAVMPVKHEVEKVTAGLIPWLCGGTVCVQSRSNVSLCVVRPVAGTVTVDVVSSSTGTGNSVVGPAATGTAWSAPL